MAIGCMCVTDVGTLIVLSPGWPSLGYLWWRQSVLLNASSQISMGAGESIIMVAPDLLIMVWNVYIRRSFE